MPHKNYHSEKNENAMLLRVGWEWKYLTLA